MSKQQLVETDNSNLELKLELRRRFLAKYHHEPPTVFDCCQGTGKIWKALRQEFPVASYWGVDLKPKPGRIKIESSRVLASPGWTFDVIDVDTYGKPWDHWEALLPRVTKPTSVFMTWGQLSFTALEHDSFAIIGIPFKVPVAVGFGRSLLDLAVRARVFRQPAKYGLSVREAIIADSPHGRTCYFGVHLIPE